MNIEYFCKDVDEWTSVYVPQYWSDDYKLYKLIEEIGEVAEVLAVKPIDVDKLGSELSDVLFATCCFANHYDNISLTEYSSITEPLGILSFNYLSWAGSRVARFLGQKNPDVPSKPKDKILKLQEQLYHVVNAVKKVADLYNINLNSAWQIKSNIRKERDANRFRKA